MGLGLAGSIESIQDFNKTVGQFAKASTNADSQCNTGCETSTPTKSQKQLHPVQDSKKKNQTSKRAVAPLRKLLCKPSAGTAKVDPSPREKKLLKRLQSEHSWAVRPEDGSGPDALQQSALFNDHCYLSKDCYDLKNKGDLSVKDTEKRPAGAIYDSDDNGDADGDPDYEPPTPSPKKKVRISTDASTNRKPSTKVSALLEHGGEKEISKTDLLKNTLEYNRLKCFLCLSTNKKTQTFSSLVALLNHFVAKHVTETKYLSCPRCQETFELDIKKDQLELKIATGLLLQHMVASHSTPIPSFVKQMKCSADGCNFESAILSRHAEHVVVHTDNKNSVMCPRCYSEMSPVSLLVHINLGLCSPIKCGYCEETFEQEYEYQLHRFNKHKNKRSLVKGVNSLGVYAVGSSSKKPYLKKTGQSKNLQELDQSPLKKTGGGKNLRDLHQSSQKGSQGITKGTQRRIVTGRAFCKVCKETFDVKEVSEHRKTCKERLTKRIVEKGFTCFSEMTWFVHFSSPCCFLCPDQEPLASEAAVLAHFKDTHVAMHLPGDTKSPGRYTCIECNFQFPFDKLENDSITRITIGRALQHRIYGHGMELPSYIRLTCPNMVFKDATEKKTMCRFCKKSVPVKNYRYHTKICATSQRNMKSNSASASVVKQPSKVLVPAEGATATNVQVHEKSAEAVTSTQDTSETVDLTGTVRAVEVPPKTASGSTETLPQIALGDGLMINSQTPLRLPGSDDLESAIVSAAAGASDTATVSVVDGKGTDT